MGLCISVLIRFKVTVIFLFFAYLRSFSFTLLAIKGHQDFSLQAGN
jgi:hypothetical protein